MTDWMENKHKYKYNVHEGEGTRLESKLLGSNTGTEDSKENIIIGQKQLLNILANYIAEIYHQPNWPEKLEVEPRRKQMKMSEALVFCKVKWKKLSRKQGMRKLQEMMMFLGMYTTCCEKMVSEYWHI
jgi:hypothetical protein